MGLPLKPWLVIRARVPCQIHTCKTQGQSQSHCQVKSLTELDFPNASFEYHRKHD